MLVGCAKACFQDSQEAVWVGNLGRAGIRFASAYAKRIATHLDPCLKLCLQLRNSIDSNIVVWISIASTSGRQAEE